MVEELGINLLVPILVFGVVVVGAIMLTNTALRDLQQRRDRGEL